LPESTDGRAAVGDPDDYLIPRDRLSEAVLERLEKQHQEPVRARPASTVVVVRDGAKGPEALLLRRPRGAGFAPGAWVFPGGVVDATDSTLPAAEPGLLERWAMRLGIEDATMAWGHVVAGVRETWEETGILLGAIRDPALSASVRKQLVSGEREFIEVAATLRLVPALDTLCYVAHWITPEVEPRRFDTRFFLAPVAADVEPVLHGKELAELRWMRPGDAVASYHAGELTMLPPTVHTLRMIEGFGSISEALDAFLDAPVPVYLPRMKAHPEGVLITVSEAD
jgi:8-oxo-dGTP pyrophosphatase MutT (NUDIX family)